MRYGRHIISIFSNPTYWLPPKEVLKKSLGVPTRIKVYSSPRGVRLKCYYALFLVCCGCDTSYIVSVHIQMSVKSSWELVFTCSHAPTLNKSYLILSYPVSSLHIYTFVVSRAFMTGAASQAGDADSSRAPGLTSGLQGSVNVHRGALLLVPQWQCISSFVFYIIYIYSAFTRTLIANGRGTRQQIELWDLDDLTSPLSS